MPTPLDPLPPGLEGQGYAAGSGSFNQTVLPQPVVGALRPAIAAAPTVGFSPVDMIARARDRFMNLFQSSTPAVPVPVLDNRTAVLENQLNDLQKRSSPVYNMRVQQFLANAR